MQRRRLLSTYALPLRCNREALVKLLAGAPLRTAQRDTRLLCACCRNPIERGWTYRRSGRYVVLERCLHPEASPETFFDLEIVRSPFDGG